MEKEYYCPNCKSKLEVFGGWGSTTYYCQVCNTMVSSKRILTQKEVSDKK